MCVARVEAKEFEVKRGVNISHWLSQSEDRGKVRAKKFTREDVKFIAEAGFDPVYGARPLKRFMQSHLETMLARAIVSGQLNPGDTATVDADSEGDLYLA
jgi:ATP-dependent Clp protease ATP-binding subunit ClpA